MSTPVRSNYSCGTAIEFERAAKTLAILNSVAAWFGCIARLWVQQSVTFPWWVKAIDFSSRMPTIQSTSAAPVRFRCGTSFREERCGYRLEHPGQHGRTFAKESFGIVLAQPYY